MTISRIPSAIDIAVTTALPEQEPILANMLELYAHDFSEFLDLELGPDGRFGYKRLPLYWKEDNRYAFLITAEGHLAGFALISRGSEISHEPDVWDMTEFFIARRYRRLGLGIKAATTIWQRFPGRWEVRVIDRNRKAIRFWARATSDFLGVTIDPVSFDKDGERWHLFSFESSCDT